MNIIYTSRNFTIEAPHEPLVDRNDGGHIIIHPKIKVTDRQQLDSQQAIEMMRMTIVAGQGLKDVMTAHGVHIGRINYQDNGNWSVFDRDGPSLHVHLFGRATTARYQKYGEACHFPNKKTHPEFYRNFKPLTPLDIMAMQLQIEFLLTQPRFSDKVWGQSTNDLP
jgi:diadenosine tetraphosphate (Ap4A) HIT family hydrolase